MADLPYRAIIGLEVHVQLATRTKLFCGCSTAFGQPPNSATCPVCLGLPGAMPVLNRLAFELGLRAALALDCTIATFTKWDRKNYFYPDLPKNYQISQYDLPFSKDGKLEIDTPAGVKRIGIIRAHLEEDAGKMLHDEQGCGNDSLVDLNRTGTPLLEIVSHPHLSSPEEARTYLEEMALLMREAGVAECKMQEGGLRCDANVNLRIPQANGPDAITPITEIKNLNSFAFLEESIRYEANRQYEAWRSDAGYLIGKRPKATWGWKEATSQTVFQRTKEESEDYRYFPDPDLPPVVVDAAWLARARAAVGESPSAMRRRLPADYGLSDYDAGVLVSRGRAVVGYFEEAAKASEDAKAACNWIANKLLATARTQDANEGPFVVKSGNLAELIKLQKRMGLSKQIAEQLFDRMAADGCSAEKAMELLGVRMVDDSAVVEIVRRAIAANAKAVADYKKGKIAAANAIKGAVMRETRGAVRAEVVERILKEELERAE